MIVNLLFGRSPIDGDGLPNPSAEGLFAYSMVETADIGTSFEDFFTSGDISAPASHPYLAGVLIQHDEVAATLGLESWQQIDSEGSTNNRGPGRDGITGGSLAREV